MPASATGSDGETSDLDTLCPARHYRIHLPNGQTLTMYGHYVGVQKIGAVISQVIFLKGAQRVAGLELNDGSAFGASLLGWTFDDETGEEVFNVRKHRGEINANAAAFLLSTPDWPSFALLIDPPARPDEMYLTEAQGSDVMSGNHYALSPDGARLTCFACGELTRTPAQVAALRCEHCGKQHVRRD